MVVHLCQTILLRQPKNIEALLLLGAAQFKLGDFDASIATNDTIIQLQPSTYEAHVNLANALQQRGTLDLALVYYKSAIKINPQHPDAFCNMGSCYLKMGRNAEAAAAYKHSLTLNPQFKEAWVTLGDVLRVQGTHVGREDAHGCYKEALSVDEAYAPAWRGIGDILRESACFFSTIDQQQDTQQRGNGSVSKSILQDAKECYKNALKIDPRLTEAATGLGLTYALLNQKNGSVYWFGVAAELNPTDAVLQANYASQLYENKNYQAAATAYQKALTANPSMKEAANNLGNALREYGKLEEAIHMYYYCITLEKQEKTSLVGKFGSAVANGAGSVDGKKRPLPASSASAAAAAGGSSNDSKSPSFDPVEEARTQRLCIVFNNLAGALRLAARYEEAANAYKQVTQFQPSSADAFANLACALKDAGNPNDAIFSYQMALTLTTTATSNDNFATKSDIFSNLMFCLQTIADWRQRDELFRRLEVMVLIDLQAGRMPAVQPFHAVSYPFSASLTKAISVAYSLECERVAQKLIEDGHVVPGLVLEDDGFATNTTTATSIRRRGKPLQPEERLRVGYVSSDYANHPLSHLMASVFGLHDKTKYEIFCYSLTPDDGSSWRTRIAKEAEHFIDVSSSTSAAIANRIFQDDQIHVLFNLNGFTKGGRNEIFALRPAPVQVSYMGFAGTMGADFMQYIVVDKVVCPDEQCRRGYHEQGLVRMPHSYFVNDYKRSFSLSSSSSTVGEGREGEGGGDGMEVAWEKGKEKKRGGTITRSDLDLPEDAIVFACFNQMYKYDPDTFRVWCNILKRVPGSVLWLLRFPPHGEPFIRHTAQAEHGIAADRIVFTNVATKEHHLARCHLADIVLDTLIYNGHTTGCDVLFSGVPLVTVASLPAAEEYNGDSGSKVKGIVKGGGRMASRVGASLAYATGYGDEMVVNSLEEYEEKAVELGMNGEKRQWLRMALEAVRESCPLFDTERWVRDMEKALDKMWEDCCRGVVADFDVD